MINRYLKFYSSSCIVEAAETDIGRSLSITHSSVILRAWGFVVGSPHSPVTWGLHLADLAVPTSAVATTHLALSLSAATQTELVPGLGIASLALIALDHECTPVTTVDLSTDVLRIVTTTWLAVLTGWLVRWTTQLRGSTHWRKLSWTLLTVSKPVAPIAFR